MPNSPILPPASADDGGAPLPPEQAFDWAWQAMHRQEWRQAARRWATLRLIYPDQGPVWIQAALAHRQLGELAEAAALLDEARRRLPDNANAWIQSARVALDDGRPREAATLMGRAVVRFPDQPAVWLQIAEAAWRSGEREEALITNRALCRRFSDRPEGPAQLAEFAMLDGDWREALSRWAAVRRDFPRYPPAYRRAAEAAEHLGDRRGARKLRLAAEFGAGWLESLERGESQEQDTIQPPRRRTARAFADLVWTKARLNLKAEANQNHLRYLWWIIDPLLYMAVFYLVFGLLLDRGGQGYVAYLLTGLVPFQWFAKTVQHSAATIVQGRGLMNLVRVSPLFFPLVAVVQNLGKQIPVFLMLAVFLVAYGLPPSLHWLALIPVILAQLLLMTVIGCLTAMIVPFARDLLNLVPTGLQFVLFCSGVFYTVDTIPEQWRTLFFVNPMANLLYQYRLILVENRWPDWWMTGWLTLGCALGLLAVWWIYRRLEAVFPRVVIE